MPYHLSIKNFNCIKKEPIIKKNLSMFKYQRNNTSIKEKKLIFLTSRKDVKIGTKKKNHEASCWSAKNLDKITNSIETNFVNRKMLCNMNYINIGFNDKPKQINTPIQLNEKNLINHYIQNNKQLPFNFCNKFSSRSHKKIEKSLIKSEISIHNFKDITLSNKCLKNNNFYLKMIRDSPIYPQSSTNNKLIKLIKPEDSLKKEFQIRFFK